MKLDKILKDHYQEKAEPDLGIDALEKQILATVQIREKRKLKIRSVFWATLFVLSSLGLMFSGASAYSQFTASGAKDIIGVAVTDSNWVFANSSEFIYSLAETMPVMPIASGLATIALLLTALRHLVMRENKQSLFKLFVYGTR